MGARLPYIVEVTASIAGGLTACISRRALERLIKVVTGFPDDAVKTTADFASSKCGIRQALSVNDFNEVSRSVLMNPG